MEGEQIDPVVAAAAEVKAEAATKPKKTRSRNKLNGQTQTAAAPEESQSVTVTFTGIGAKDVSKAVNALLLRVAVKTKTEPPNKDEVDAISSGIAVGLSHTKIAIDPKSGPWVPLMLATAAYALPRIIDVAMKAAEKEEAAHSGPFPEGQTVPIPPRSGQLES